MHIGNFTSFGLIIQTIFTYRFLEIASRNSSLNFWGMAVSFRKKMMGHVPVHSSLKDNTSGHVPMHYSSRKHAFGHVPSSSSCRNWTMGRSFMIFPFNNNYMGLIAINIK